MYEKQRSHIYSTYYAPRGRSRIYEMGIQLSLLYLHPADKLIGVIGEPGSGKSALIQGMFPGLELTNDDDGVNVRPLPLLDQSQSLSFFTPHTYHIDIRFEMGFSQLSTLVDAVVQAVNNGKRVVVEHFELIYPVLRRNADLLIGVGEEVFITRPNIFGPDPQEMAAIAQKSLPYRLMAHTAEDLVERYLTKEDFERCKHGDIKHGFILYFPYTPPEMDIAETERKVHEEIASHLPIAYCDEQHITIGGAKHLCTGPRTHVKNTGDVRGFRLLPHFVYDKYAKHYMLIGCVGEDSDENIRKLQGMLDFENQSALLSAPSSLI
jgi:hypothetical protein